MQTSQQLTTGEGAVAVFRWFTDGENWAYHPWYETRRLELVKALDPPLKARKEGEIVASAFGGFLVGELVPDRDCPDPHTQGRSPCVVRVAFVPKPPTAGDKAVVLANLKSVANRGPGVDPGLRIDLPPAAEGRGTPEPTRKRRLKAALIFGIGLLVAGGGYLLIGRTAGPPPEGGGQTPSAAETKLLAELLVGRGADRVTVESLQGDPKKLARLVASHFSRQGQGITEELKGNHPDVVFLQRLPERPAGGDTDLRATLAALEAHLRGEQKREGTPAAKEVGLAQLIGTIRKETDYVSWWTGGGYKCRRYDKDEGGNDVASKVARRWADPVKGFTPADAVWQKSYAKPMRRALAERWRVSGVTTGDVDGRPWFVIHTFLHFTSRAHLAGPVDETNSWPELFVARLPESPDLGGTTTLDATKATLSSLLNRLSPDASPGSTEDTLVGRIAESLDYDEWIKRARTVAPPRRNKAEVLPQLNGYVDRFRAPPEKR